MRMKIVVHPNNLEALVQCHMPFIIHTASKTTGRYISVEHDDVFSIALEGFSEAVERFDESRGEFLSFAGLVMESRLLTYLKKESRGLPVISLDEMAENGEEPASMEPEEESDLRTEILDFRRELQLFGLTLERLADDAPKHDDTRKRAFEIGKNSGNEHSIVEQTYQKRRLPIREVCRLNSVSEKIVKRSKTFILAVLIIFARQFTGMIDWLKEARCSHV